MLINGLIKYKRLLHYKFTENIVGGEVKREWEKGH